MRSRMIVRDVFAVVLRFVCIVATATVVLQHSSKFVATIAVTARLKLFRKAAYIFGVAERVLGVGEESWILAVLDGRYVAGYVRRWEGVVGGYQPWMWRGPRCGYDNPNFVYHI